jgi:hypothetical protein
MSQQLLWSSLSPGCHLTFQLPWLSLLQGYNSHGYWSYHWSLVDMVMLIWERCFLLQAFPTLFKCFIVMLFAYVQHLRAFSNGPTAKAEQASSTWYVQVCDVVHQGTWHNKPEACNFSTCCCNNLKLNTQGITYINPLHTLPCACIIQQFQFKTAPLRTSVEK